MSARGATGPAAPDERRGLGEVQLWFGTESGRGGRAGAGELEMMERSA